MTEPTTADRKPCGTCRERGFTEAWECEIQPEH